MSEAADIDKIDDIMDMVRTMTVMGVSSKGLRTLDEMKEKVKETLKMSQKKSSWTAKEVRIYRAVYCIIIETFNIFQYAVSMSQY